MNASRPRTTNRLPTWLRILLVGVILILAAGLLLPYVLDADQYRTLIVSMIESQTRRKATIGKIRARLLPHVGFVAEGFHLSNPPGFAEGEMLSAGAIRGNLAWGPLLRREFQLTSVELERPKLTLLEDDSGQTNYSARVGSSPSSGESKTSSAPALSKLSSPVSESAFPRLEIERIDLTDAEIIRARVADRARTVVPSFRLRKVSAELSHVTLDPIQPKQWQGNVSLEGVLLDLAGWKTPVAFHSGRMELRDGRIESEFSAAMGKAADVKGKLHVAEIERPVADFELSASQLDLDKVLALQVESSPKMPSARKPGRSELLAQGRVTAQRIEWGAYSASNGSVEVRVFTDRLELWPVTLALYGGTLQISLRSDRTQTPERFSSNVQVRNLDMGRMLAATPSTRGKLSGIGELNLQLLGALGADWQKSVSGSGHFAIRDGRLPGISLGSGLESLVKLSGVGGETPFSLLQGDLAIGQGRIASRQIHLDSAEGTVELHGSLGLDGALNYDGQAVLAPRAGTGPPNAATAITDILGGVLKRNVSRVTVPLSVRGTLQAPKFLPGPGRASIESASPPSQTPPAQLPDKKKGILDLFRRP